MLQVYLQVILYGIYLGSLYGLAAIGFALIFGVMGVLQVAHGSIIMLSAYLCFWFFDGLRIDPLLSLPIVMIVFFFFGIIMFRLLFSSMIKLSYEERGKNSLLLAFGITLVLDNLAIMGFTANIRTVSPIYSGMAFKFMGVQMPYIGLFNLALGGLLIAGLHLLLTKTYLGKSIRAVSQSYESAAMVGVNFRRTFAISMGVASALGGAGGVLILLYSGVDPTIGMDWTLKAFLITLLAGTGRISGLFFCGLFFGILEGVGSITLGPYKELIGLFLFVIVLLWRPQGLFSKAST